MNFAMNRIFFLVALLAVQKALGLGIFQRAAFSSSSTQVITGPRGKPAKSKEEDLMLTVQLILDHEARSTTVSKEQFIMQMEEVKHMPEPVSPVDVSVPYDAAAKLAYEASAKNMPYSEFKSKYEADAVAQVKSKQGMRDEPKKRSRFRKWIACLLRRRD